MDKNKKHYIWLLGGALVLLVILLNLQFFWGFARKLISLMLPIIIGSILALFISVPMNGIENILRKLSVRFKKNLPEKQVHIFSFILTLISVTMVLTIMLSLLVPEIVQSSQNLYVQIENNIPQWQAYLDSLPINIIWFKELLADVNVEQSVHQFMDGIESVLPNVLTAIFSTVNGVMTVVLSMIVASYISLGREQICRHVRKCVCAYLKNDWAASILHVCRMFYKSFTKYLSGQSVEAVILGIMMFTAFKIFRLPYGSIVGVLTAVCALIPYVGAFVSCSISIVLTMCFDPSLVLRCAFVYLIVQFIENQFIYPKVVGESVGLPAFYILLAAMTGGKIFGILGIVFSIPLMSVVFELVKTDVNQRMKEMPEKEKLFSETGKSQNDLSSEKLKNMYGN